MTVEIVVVSDTHLPRAGRDLPDELLRAMGRADMIVHLGDLSEMSVLERLGEIGPVMAVSGNADSPEVRAALPLHRRIETGGHTIMLMHGHVGGATALASARAVSGVDAVLFGHSHQPYNTVERGILLFNPGSPIDRRRAPFRSYGRLAIDGEIQAGILPLP